MSYYVWEFENIFSSVLRSGGYEAAQSPWENNFPFKNPVSVAAEQMSWLHLKDDGLCLFKANFTRHTVLIAWTPT